MKCLPTAGECVCARIHLDFPERIEPSDSPKNSCAIRFQAAFPGRKHCLATAMKSYAEEAADDPMAWLRNGKSVHSQSPRAPRPRGRSFREDNTGRCHPARVDGDREHSRAIW